MLTLQVILIAAIFVPVNSQCISSSFWDDIEDEKKPSCPDGNLYIRGFNVNFEDYMTMYLDNINCCVPNPEWRTDGALAVYALSNAMDGKKFLRCPKGYFLNGLYRDKFGLDKYKWYVFEMRRSRCTKPSAHPLYYSKCYTQDAVTCFNTSKRWCACNDSYYVTGLHMVHSSHGDFYDHLLSFQCCSMALKQQDIQNTEDFKTVIMNRTLVSMTELAYGLGYKYCKGVNGVFCGEDFVRVGDKWYTSEERFSDTDVCLDDECTEDRLQIFFNDWHLQEKDIKYGNISTDNYQPETVDSGTIYNHGKTNVTESFEISKTVTDTITNFVETSITNTDGKPIDFSFKVEKFPPRVTGTTLDKIQKSKLTNNTKQDLTSRIYKQSVQINMNPRSIARYNVTVTKIRTTIPYTAVVIGTFSVRFIGYLKWDDKNIDGPSMNYHHRYQREKKDRTFDYRFGDKHVPFYRALRKERDTQAGPWLWNEILKNIPHTRKVIDRLIDERLYEFKIKGTLELISGVKIEVIWS